MVSPDYFNRIRTPISQNPSAHEAFKFELLRFSLAQVASTLKRDAAIEVGKHIGRKD